ncbi:major facilitator superfamily protein [Escherichia coli]|uniref:Major facilitator superfamily protein n=1 Tax=Escherichia coli TaxID=562 RepID=A0A2X3J9E3_ECOLX|nr:major facilitator superfamily protein [Escherichia coli]
MTNSNRIKLTWISFLSYALTGALVIVTGIVMGNIAIISICLFPV